MDHPNTTKVTTGLNHLVSIAQDGVNGLGRAFDDAQDPQLKTTLSELR